MRLFFYCCCFQLFCSLFSYCLNPKDQFFFFPPLDFIYHFLANNAFPKIVYHLRDYENVEKNEFSITDRRFELRLEMPEQAMLLSPLSPGFCACLVTGWRCCPRGVPLQWDSRQRSDGPRALPVAMEEGWDGEIGGRTRETYTI